MSEDKSSAKGSEHSSEKSAESSLDKKELFAKLFRVQYPMSQEAPVTKLEEDDYAKMSYNEQMDALIKKYEDEL